MTERNNDERTPREVKWTMACLKSMEAYVSWFAVACMLLAPGRVDATSLVVGVQDRRLDIDASFAEDSVQNDQTSVRATYTWDVNERLTLVATGGAASSYLGLNDTRVTGATDLRMRGLFRPTDEWVIGFGSIVPLGLYELSANEVVAAQWIWNPRSGFPLSRLGEGLGWELTAARAFQISGDTSLGLAAAYLRHAEFDLLDGNTGEYRLGDEVSVSAAVDWRFQGDVSALLDVSHRISQADELSGIEFVEKGARTSVGASVRIPGRSFVTQWTMRATFQGDNTLSAAATDSLAISEAAGIRLHLGGRVARSVGESTLIYLDGQLNRIAGTDYAVPTDGTAFLVGPGVGWRMNEQFSIGARLAFLSSSGDDDLDYTGTDALVTLEFRP